MNQRGPLDRVERIRWPTLAASFVASAVLMGAAGCGTIQGPAYERPEVADKPQWSHLEGREISTSEVIQPDWWHGFGDPYLLQLIQRAIDQGLDMRIAALRLDRAGIQLGKDRFSQTPKLAVSPADSIARGKSNNQKSATTRETESLGAALTWELDLWGKIRKDMQAADARYRATEMDWRGTQLTLIASVAERYFQIRQFDEQIAQQVDSKRQAEQLLDIYYAQHKEGMVPETRIRSQKAEINGLQNRLIELRRGRTESELKLATLLGVPAGELSVPVGSLRDSVRIIEMPEVLPADVLARRPDVLKAEYNVLQAHHLVGKARLARLPTFSLTGAAKTGTSFVSTVINTWTFGLAASWAGLFDRDLKIDVKLNEADVRIAREEYRKTVLEAYEEVEIALVNLNARRQQIKELEAQVADLQVVRNVQDARLREGLVSQLEVFDTERTLLAAQQEILSMYQLVLTDTVTLYKALGGGWESARPGVEPKVKVSQSEK
ncbi:TolC family protein [Steroidobacter sp. S1-65]|uniref:TolC family protein n=1 Tax=Steroidobacter gossypii TaxID=2805490 RepID=A0ABS1X0W5_9GAMM|nr:TolC family protein [Steroidobacter gossypii]MBM0106851.1 TolC family protein [Steroidobacter gossypii]